MDKEKCVQFILNHVRRFRDPPKISDQTDITVDLRFSPIQWFCLLDDLERELGIRFERLWLFGDDLSTVGKLWSAVQRIQSGECAPMTPDAMFKHMVAHAGNTVPYYTERWSQTFNADDYDKIDHHKCNAIPILTKEDLQIKTINHISQPYSQLYADGDLIRCRSIGAHGKCVEAHWHPLDVILAKRGIWRYRTQWYGVSRDDKCLTFHSALYAGNRFMPSREPLLYDRDGIQLSVSQLALSEQIDGEIMRRLLAFEADWIATAPSVLLLLIDLLKPRDISLPTVRYIELSGESASEGMRGQIERAFPCAQIAELYGGREMGEIALECPHGRLHVIEENAIIQTHTDTLLVTTLRNPAGPLVRYDTEDAGSISPASCRCGCTTPVLSLYSGRESALICLPNGERRSIYTLMHAIEHTNQEFNCPIAMCAFEQISPDEIIVYLTLFPKFKPWRQAIIKVLTRELNKAVGNGIEWGFPESRHERKPLFELSVQKGVEMDG